MTTHEGELVFEDLPLGELERALYDLEVEEGKALMFGAPDKELGQIQEHQGVLVHRIDEITGIEE